MKTGTLFIDNNIIETVLACSEQEQSRGLMYCGANHPVMSFIYDSPRINKFWMNNVPVPLDIVFCNNGYVDQIYCGKPLSTDVIGDNKFSNLVIELPYGTINKIGIKIGQKINIKY